MLADRIQAYSMGPGWRNGPTNCSESVKYRKNSMGLVTETYYPCTTDYGGSSPTLTGPGTWIAGTAEREATSKDWLEIGDEDSANSRCGRS